MPALLTTKYRHDVAVQLQQFALHSNLYLTVGKTTSFTSDITPPTPTSDVQSSHIDIYDNMIFGRRIGFSDTAVMVPRNDWVAGTVYTAYDHQDAQLLDAGVKSFVVVNEGISYTVFKCLSNNGSSPSLYRPSIYETSASDVSYFTADGYQWKYMYSITKDDFEKFATADFIPVTEDANVIANAVDGSLESIQVVSGGSRYNAIHSGMIQVAREGGNNQIFIIESSASSNNHFYEGSVLKIVTGPGAGQQRDIVGYLVSGSVKRVVLSSAFSSYDVPTESSVYEISPGVTVTGDGSGFVGRAIVDPATNVVTSIEVSAGGVGYTWATATVVSNTGIIEVGTGNAVVANNAVLRAVISPPGGHGANPATELGGTNLGISVTLNTTESAGKSVANNDFRIISIINNPSFAKVVLGVTNAVSFSVGDTVKQPVKIADTTQYNTGTISGINVPYITLTNVKGVFSISNGMFSNTVIAPNSGIPGLIYNSSGSVQGSVSNTDVNNPSLYFDQTTTLVGSVIGGSQFTEDETVVQSTHANGTVYFANTSTIKMINVRGVFNQAETQTTSGLIMGSTSKATANVNAITLPDLVKGSGEVLYIENITPITRTAGQSETMKLVLNF